MAVGLQGELIGQKGYLGLALEATANTAVTPTDWIPYATESMTTDINLDEDTTASGIYAHTYQALQGQRTHTGTIEVLAEPNTAAKLANMLGNVGASTGAGPYTWPFTFTGATNSYTLDISIGNQQVKRFTGCMISKLGIKFDKNVMHFVLEFSALRSFQLRTLSGTPTGTGPYTIALDTTYDPSPTTGLVVGDLLQVQNHTTNATSNITVASIVDGTHITTTTNVTTFGSGDYLYLRPATPSLSALVATPFLWAKTNFCFGSTAAAALAATATPCEQGSSYEIVHSFNDNKGELRSGSFDPASLVRVPPQPTIKIKKFFASESDLAAWLNITKQALVVRHYAGSTNQYEFRVTFNHLKLKAYPIKTEANKVIYVEIEYIAQWDTSDAQQVGITVINNISSLS